MSKFLQAIWTNDDGQDVAEYAIMLAVIALVVITTVELIGTSANSIFSQIASTLSSAAAGS